MLLQKDFRGLSTDWVNRILTWEKVNDMLQISNQIISLCPEDRKSSTCLKILREHKRSHLLIEPVICVFSYKE